MSEIAEVISHTAVVVSTPKLVTASDGKVDYSADAATGALVDETFAAETDRLHERENVIAFGTRLARGTFAKKYAAKYR